MNLSPPNSSRFFTRWRLACLAVLLVAGLLYLPALSGEFILDDLMLVGGPGIGGGKSFVHCFTRPFLLSYYRPIVSAVFYGQNQFSRHIPFFYHQTNILTHIATTGLVLLLLRIVFPERRRIALLGALVYAVHPIQVGAVAWIGGLTDSLCAFWMAAFACLLARAAQTDGHRRLLFLLLSALAYGAALFTKEQMLPALLLVPLAFHCFARPGRPNAPEARRKALLPYLLVWVGFLAAWLLCVPPVARPLTRSLAAQAGQCGRTLTYYTLALVTPSPRWMHTFSVGIIERAGLLGVLAGYAVAAAGLFLFLRWWKTQPAAAWFLAWIGLTLALVSNALPLASIVVAPYRASVASIGLAALLGWAVGRRWEGTPVRERIRESLRWAAITPFLFWCAGLTFWGAGRWQNAETIFTCFARYDPDGIWGRQNLVGVLLNAKKTEPALRHLEDILMRLFGPDWRNPEAVARAVRSDPVVKTRIQENQGNSSEPEEWVALLYGQMGAALLDRGETERAHPLLLVGRAVHPTNFEVNRGLGRYAFLKGDYRQAEQWLRIAIAENDRSTIARGMLAETYAAQKKWQEARRTYEECLRRDPDGGAGYAYLRLAEACYRLGDRAGAETGLKRAAATPMRKIAGELLDQMQAGREPRFESLFKLW